VGRWGIMDAQVSDEVRFVVARLLGHTLHSRGQYSLTNVAYAVSHILAAFALHEAASGVRASLGEAFAARSPLVLNMTNALTRKKMRGEDDSGWPVRWTQN
jgi:hypothetical protein